MTDGHPRSDTLRLTVRTTHTRLQAIRTSARQHLVDTQHVERVQAHAKVETFLTSLGHHVLVGSNAPRLHRLGADLFLLETASAIERFHRSVFSLLISSPRSRVAVTARCTCRVGSVCASRTHLYALILSRTSRGARTPGTLRTNTSSYPHRRCESSDLRRRKPSSSPSSVDPRRSSF